MTKIDGLRINWNSGEGELKLTEEFLTGDSLFRADVLRDWMYSITAEYNKAVEEIWGVKPKVDADE